VTVQEALARLLDGHDLSREQARDVMNEVMEGEATPAQIAGFLVALRLKGETADEIAGCAEAMRAHVLAVRPKPPDRIERSIDELGFGFLFAPTHHPAMRHAAPVRRELAARTVFNVLGPLTNPAGARAQVVGVYAPSLVRTIAEVLAQLGARRAFVVHGAGGIDELSPAGPNLVCEVVDGAVHEREIDPLDLGVPRCDPDELRGGSPDENAAAIHAVFTGEEGGRRSAVLLNAAGAIAAAGHADDLREGLERAREALDSGAAATRLDELIAFSREEVPA
jgi:anthranilate phosphoribosyltransferase